MQAELTSSYELNYILLEQGMLHGSSQNPNDEEPQLPNSTADVINRNDVKLTLPIVDDATTSNVTSNVLSKSQDSDENNSGQTAPVNMTGQAQETCDDGNDSYHPS